MYTLAKEDWIRQNIVIITALNACKKILYVCTCLLAGHCQPSTIENKVILVYVLLLYQPIEKYYNMYSKSCHLNNVLHWGHPLFDNCKLT